MNKLEIRKELYMTRIIIRSELNILIVDCCLLDSGHTFYSLIKELARLWTF